MSKRPQTAALDHTNNSFKSSHSPLIGSCSRILNLADPYKLPFYSSGCEINSGGRQVLSSLLCWASEGLRRQGVGTGDRHCEKTGRLWHSPCCPGAGDQLGKGFLRRDKLCEPVCCTDAQRALSLGAHFNGGWDRRHTPQTSSTMGIQK